MGTTLGITLACFDDIGARGEVCTTDEQICRQIAYHRLTNDRIFGRTDPTTGQVSETAASYGYNLITRINSATVAEDSILLGPKLVEVLQRSGRIASAEVECRDATPEGGSVDLYVNVRVVPTSGGGPYSWIFRLNAGTFKRVGAGAS